jgi:hypothetical protein
MAQGKSLFSVNIWRQTMLKRISRRALIFSAILTSAAMALPAAAQTQGDQSTTPVVDQVIVYSEIDFAPLNLASKIMDADAYTPGGDKLGGVSDIVLDENGNALAITVGVGGFLGIDETYVAIPISKLMFQNEASGLRVVADVSKDEVTNAAKAD